MRSNIAKSALWVTFSEIFFNLSGFVIHSVLGRFLGPADYGRYGLIITLTTMVIILIGNGIPTAMSKYISEYFETDLGMVRVIKRQAVILQSILIAAITIIFYFSIPLISSVLGDPTLIPLFKISTWIIPAFAAASFYFSYYTGLHRFNFQATLKTLRSVFRIVLVIGLAYFFKVEGSIVAYILAPFFVFLVAYGIDRFEIASEMKSEANLQKSAADGKKLWDAFDWKKLTNYAWQIIIFFLAYELLISIDLYMVKGILRDDNLTGIYNAVLTVGRIPYYIFYAMTIFLLPMVSRSTSQNNHAQTNQILTQSLRIMMILLIPMIILMSVFAKPIIMDFYGKNYVSGAYAMSILEYGVGFLTIFYVLSFAMNGAAKTKIVMWISILGLALNTVLNYFLIQKLSITGSAIATSITSLVIMIIMLCYIYRDFGVTIKLRSFLNAVFAGIIIYFASRLFPQGQISFILWSVILFSAYIGILYILGEVKKEDIVYVKSLAKLKRAKPMEEDLSGNEPSA